MIKRLGTTYHLIDLDFIFKVTFMEPPPLFIPYTHTSEEKAMYHDDQPQTRHLLKGWGSTQKIHLDETVTSSWSGGSPAGRSHLLSKLIWVQPQFLPPKIICRVILPCIMLLPPSPFSPGPA